MHMFEKITGEMVAVLACFAYYAVSVLQQSSNRKSASSSTGTFPAHVLFIMGIVLVTFLGRSATWSMGQCNVDEAQWLAGAVTLDQGYDFWRVDGTTSGPYVIHFLWLWNQAFATHSFTTAKILTTAVWGAVGVLSYFSLLQFADTGVARLLVIPFVLMAALMRGGDMVGYNGEHLPILLLATAVFLLLSLHAGKSNRFAIASLLGLVLGLLPYSKLQAIPMGFLIGVLSLWHLRHERAIFGLLSTVSIAISMPLVVLVFRGELVDFITSYISENAQYAASHSSLPMLKRFYAFPLVWRQIETGAAFVLVSLLTLASFAIVAVVWLRHSLRKNAFLVSLSILYLAVAAYCVAQPGTFFEHYFLFMFHPLWLCTVVFITISLSGTSLSTRRRACFAWSIALFSVTAVMSLPEPHNEYNAPVAFRIEPQVGKVTKLISQVSSPTDALTVWGWAAHLHVESQLPQATKEAHTYRQLTPGPYQSFFLERYIRELEERREGLILVDATHSSESKYFSEEQHQLENFPQLADFVRQHLEYVGSVNGCRVFKSKKTLANE